MVFSPPFRIYFPSLLDGVSLESIMEAVLSLVCTNGDEH